MLQLFFGDVENPGKLRKLGLCFLKAKRAVVEVAEPVNLQEVLAAAPKDGRLRELAQEIRRELINRIDLKRRVITGPVIKSREEVMELTLTDPGLTRVHGAPGGDRKEEALQDQEERPGLFLGDLGRLEPALHQHHASPWCSWLSRHLFEGVAFDTEGFERVKEAGQRGNLIFVPCHKSHLDYLLLNNLIYQHHMHPPRIAAGKNLSFWPLGPLFRGSGAFFIRRRFLGGKLYAEVLYTYIKTLIKTGYNLEFFIEGGRSRTGKLVLPKLGLLQHDPPGLRRKGRPDLMFVPTFIGYDQVLEEKAYLKELEGPEPRRRNRWASWCKARKFLQKRYGRAYIQFSEPISLKEYLARHPAGGARKSDHLRNHAQNLAYRIIQAINEISVVTPFSLVCAALLTYPRKGVYRRELLQIIQVLYDYLKAQGGAPGRFPGEPHLGGGRDPGPVRSPQAHHPHREGRGPHRRTGAGRLQHRRIQAAPCWNTTKTISSISSCPPPWSPWPSWPARGLNSTAQQVLDGLRLSQRLFQE